MMESKHTLGPWKVAGRGNPKGELSIFNPNGEEIGCVRSQGRLKDAHLIAAAPELLEALRECVTDDGAYSMTRNEIATLKMRIATINAIVKAAIAKAEGKQ